MNSMMDYYCDRQQSSDGGMRKEARYPLKQWIHRLKILGGNARKATANAMPAAQTRQAYATAHRRELARLISEQTAKEAAANVKIQARQDAAAKKLAQQIRSQYDPRDIAIRDFFERNPNPRIDSLPQDLKQRVLSGASKSALSSRKIEEQARQQAMQWHPLINRTSVNPAAARAARAVGHRAARNVKTLNTAAAAAAGTAAGTVALGGVLSKNDADTSINARFGKDSPYTQPNDPRNAVKLQQQVKRDEEAKRLADAAAEEERRKADEASTATVDLDTENAGIEYDGRPAPGRVHIQSAEEKATEEGDAGRQAEEAARGAERVKNNVIAEGDEKDVDTPQTQTQTAPAQNSQGKTAPVTTGGTAGVSSTSGGVYGTGAGAGTTGTKPPPAAPGKTSYLDQLNKFVEEHGTDLKYIGGSSATLALLGALLSKNKALGLGLGALAGVPTGYILRRLMDNTSKA